jgi:rod shape-determining protein MreC
MRHLDRTPPPFFKQGPSALSKLMVCSALALFLMVADTASRSPSRCAPRWPWCCSRCNGWPCGRCWRALGGDYFGGLHQARSTEEGRRRKLILQAQRPTRSNSSRWRTRSCASCWNCASAERHAVDRGRSLYDAADPYTRKVIIDKGMAQGMMPPARR